MNNIPRNLIVFYHDKSDLPEPFASALATTQATNPDYSLIFLDDQSILKIIKDNFPHFSEIYPRIRIPAARADVARLIALYLFGGIYVDIEMAFHKPFADLLDPGEELLLIRKDDNPIFRGREQAANLINSVLGASKHSPFILECLKRAFFNLSTGYYNFSVHIATGPLMITEAYLQYKKVTNDSVRIKKFSNIAGKYFKMQPVAGITNSWVVEQRNGILTGTVENCSSPHSTVWKEAGGD